MVVTMVMVIAYCYGRGTPTCPRQKGSFLAIFQYGGAQAQEFATVRPENKVCRVCGSHSAVWGERAESPVSAGLCGMSATRKVRTWVRTRFAGLHPGQTKNGQGRKLNAGAGLQPIRWLGCRNRPTSLCARSDASGTGCRNFP